MTSTDEVDSIPPGYVVTSHSSQGQTAARVLMHVETERASEKLVNQRLAYVAVSRGQYDARIYTDDKAKLARASDRDVSHTSALAREGLRTRPVTKPLHSAKLCRMVPVDQPAASST
jgi:ATP-dependent exoDNAse (exonuclease V) alpha subunit